jgi:glucan phosphoethanolaminetransferase (alkaline phosphatase superfamily)
MIHQMLRGFSLSFVIFACLFFIIRDFWHSLLYMTTIFVIFTTFVSGYLHFYNFVYEDDVWSRFNFLKFGSVA